MFQKRNESGFINGDENPVNKDRPTRQYPSTHSHIREEQYHSKDKSENKNQTFIVKPVKPVPVLPEQFFTPFKNEAKNGKFSPQFVPRNPYSVIDSPSFLQKDFALQHAADKQARSQDLLNWVQNSREIELQNKALAELYKETYPHLLASAASNVTQISKAQLQKALLEKVIIVWSVLC